VSLTPYITGHFRDESFQKINCTGTDNQKQGNKTHIHPTHKKETEKLSYLANKPNYAPVWYSF